MKYKEKAEGGIELQLEAGERELVLGALRHYSAYCKDEEYILSQKETICEIMNALDS